MEVSHKKVPIKKVIVDNYNGIIDLLVFIDSVTAEQVTVRAGSSYRNIGGVVYRVANIHQNPLFNEDTFDFDIALLRLQTTLKIGPGVRPIVVASSGTIIPGGVQAQATGWGRLSEGGNPASQLQVVSLPVISTENCRSYYPPESITNRMICAGFDEGGKDTCEGDSGGPIVVSGIQIGITSWGGKCAEAGSPGVYTKLSEFREYIDSLIQ